VHHILGRVKVFGRLWIYPSLNITVKTLTSYEINYRLILQTLNAWYSAEYLYLILDIFESPQKSFANIHLRFGRVFIKIDLQIL